MNHVSNTGNSLFGVFLGPLFGYLADAWSLQASLLVYQWTFVPLQLIGVFWVWKVLAVSSQTATRIGAGRRSS